MSGVDWKSNRLYLVGIVLAGLAAYSNSFSCAFVFDDGENIVEDQSIRSWSSTIFATYEQIPPGMRDRPVVRWSFALNYSLGEYSPWGYHVINLAIHLVAGCLLFDIVRRTLLLDETPGRLKGRASALAFIVALVWTVHPLQTESVTYIVQRCESMMGMLFLGCLYCLLRGSQSGNSVRWNVGAVICCWLGMGCKEVMATAPLIVLLYDRCFLSRSVNEVVRRRWWVYVAMVPPVVYLLVRASRVIFNAGGSEEIVEELVAVHRPDRWSYLRTQPWVVLHYLRLCFWPTGQCLDYWWPVASGPLQVVVPSIIVVGMIGASMVALRFRPRLGFLGASIFIILSPTSTIIPLHLAFEHRMYLPLASVVALSVLAVAQLFDQLERRNQLEQSARQRLAVTLVVAVVVGLVSLTWLRNEAYQSGVHCWRDVVRKADHNPRAHLNLAVALYNRAGSSSDAGQQQRDFSEAEFHFERGIELDPNNPFSRVQYGLMLYQLAMVEQLSDAKISLLVRAIEQFEKVIELKPKETALHRQVAARIHHDLGLVFLGANKRQFAIEQFRKALGLNPEHSKVKADLQAALATEDLSGSVDP